MTRRRLPAIFVGSSVEGLAVAYAIQENLEYDAEPTVWPQGVFQPNGPVLADLIGETRNTDFAVFVFTPDDVRIMRRNEASVPRDNVIFELGLFIGALGAERCFFVAPRDTRLELPSDLLGVTPLTYDPDRADGRLVAALGPACNRIRRAFGNWAPSPPKLAEQPIPPAVAPKTLATQFIRIWNGPELSPSRAVLQKGIPLHRIEDESGQAAAALERVFAFLESMSDAVLSARAEEQPLRDVFEDPLKLVWERASTFLAPLNQADEWWDPPPRIAQLYDRWSRP